MMSDTEVRKTIDRVLSEFSWRHLDFKKHLLRHFAIVEPSIITDHPLSDESKLLIGAYFTHEYALESAALFNPSIVPHPNQSDLPEGSTRFILSLRAVGEGHISSIVFREGTISAEGEVIIRKPTSYVTEPTQTPCQIYDKDLFNRKLTELRINREIRIQIMKKLSDSFTLAELTRAIEDDSSQNPPTIEQEESIKTILALAYSNFTLVFDETHLTSEKVLFPFTSSQEKGIEDVRFVMFIDDDGSCTYYGTYTAYDGHTILPQLIETKDFTSFKFLTLNGPAAQNKGMALFPRKINGQYVMISRQDNENLFLMYSDNIHFWFDAKMILRPTFPWEFTQIGNCGSPIETDEGWLVLSHGVGPMRKYCIGAFLLDKDDPSKLIGRLREPLIEPKENERSGYVPNVVYTCGMLQAGDTILIPYAMSDFSSSFATVSLKKLLSAMEAVE
ncbi:MAG TPA: glycosidase [Treponema sp.]|nr:glycosidase [Treponema sp.]